MAMARPRRNTREAPSTAMTLISTKVFCGRIASTTSARIRVGSDISTSLMRDRIMSTRPPQTAARKLKNTPMTKAATVAVSATISVVRAP